MSEYTLANRHNRPEDFGRLARAPVRTPQTRANVALDRARTSMNLAVAFASDGSPRARRLVRDALSNARRAVLHLRAIEAHIDRATP